MIARRLEGDEPAVSPQVLSDMLSLVLGGKSIPPSVVATWTPRERETAAEWAAAEHLGASDSPVQRLEKPELVRRSAEICASPAVAQLVTEAWALHKERLEHGGYWDDQDARELATQQAAQDAITGLLVLLDGDSRRQEAGRLAWRETAGRALRMHPGGLRTVDLMAMLGTGCPSAEALETWLRGQEATGAIAWGPGRGWRLKGARP